MTDELLMSSVNGPLVFSKAQAKTWKDQHVQRYSILKGHVSSAISSFLPEFSEETTELINKTK
jgi:hypothetical protein